MNRRGFLTAAATLLAAPTIVRVASLMPVKPIPYMGTFSRITSGQIIAYTVFDPGDRYQYVPVLIFEPPAHPLPASCTLSINGVTRPMERLVQCYESSPAMRELLNGSRAYRAS